MGISRTARDFTMLLGMAAIRNGGFISGLFELQ